MEIYNDEASKKMIHDINRQNYLKKNMLNANLDENRYKAFEKSKGNSKITNKTKSKIPRYIIVLIIAGITAALSPKITDLKNDIDAAMYASSYDNTVGNNTYKVDKGYAYNISNIATDVLFSDSDEYLDIKIYNLYLDFDYHVIEQMDKVFGFMYSIIANNPDAFTEKQKTACFYPDFQSYLTARGFTDLDDYKRKMNEIIVLYKDYNNQKDTLAEKISNIGGR